MTTPHAVDDEREVTDPQGYAPTANPFGQREHRIPPRRDAQRADERRLGPLTQPPIGKDMQRALDKAQKPTKGQTENARVVVQQSILTLRKVPQIHWRAVKEFVADRVKDDTDIAEYKSLINRFLDDILGKPDYGQDPHKWTDYIRGCIANDCRAAGIVNDTNIDQIRDAVLEVARADGKMGDEAHVLELAKEEIRAFNEVRAEAAKPVTDTGAWRFESDAFRKLVLDAQAGDYFIRQIIGADPAGWASVRAECLRQIREASSAAAKDGDGQPIASSIRQDWSAAAKAVQDMQPPAAVAPKTNGHTADPDQILFAVPNHLKRELGVDETIVGKHVFAALAAPLPDYVAKHGPAKTWTAVEDYVASQKAAAKVQAAKPQAPAVNSDDLREVFGRNKITDETPEPVSGPSSPEKGQVSKQAPQPETRNGGPVAPPDVKNDTSVTPAPNNVIDASKLFTHPDTVIVYPQDRGNVIYKGVRFFVSTHYGGTLAMAKPLLEDWIANRDLIDPSCLVKQASGTLTNAAMAASMGPVDDLPPLDDSDAPPDHEFNAQVLQTVSNKIKTEDGIGISRTIEGDKPKYTIYFMVGNKEAEWPLTVTGPRNITMLENFLIAAADEGIIPRNYRNLEKWQVGKRYPLCIRASYTQGKESKNSTPANRRYYKDFVSFEAVNDAVPLAS